ncbi:MAG: alpha/beta fold hydrolase, partial [Ktedonobacterales bacterium]
VLLHDFYPGASNFEFRDIFAPLAERYRVYAPDWLGFGMSEHPAVAYTGEFYASMLAGFLRDVVAAPAVVVAHGRAANIAVRAASDAPALFERVTLVAPDVFAGVLAEPTLGQTLLRASRRASLGIVPYALLSTRPALRWLTATRSQRAAEGVPADDEVERLYASAHQVGGQHALLAALTGDLDLAMPNAFALLEPPVLIVSGERDQRHPRVDMEDIAVLNPHADLDVIPGAGDIVFADAPDAFVRAVMGWLDTPASRHALDEGALLQPAGGLAPQLSADEQAPSSTPPLTAATHGGLVMDIEEATPEPATDADAAPEHLDENHAGEDEMTGTPASVVPGVSDAGMEGPATVDMAGVATLEEPTVTLGPESAPSNGDGGTMAEAAVDASPDELLPEAGESQPASAVEQEARAGVDPARLPDESNIADVAPTESEYPGRGDVAGLVQTMQT